MNDNTTVSRLRHRNARLAESLKDVKQAMAEKDAMLSELAHEVRTSLNAIIGISRMQEDLTTNPELKRLAAMVHAGGEDLLELLNSILQLKVSVLHEDDTEQVCLMSKDLRLLTDRFSILARTKGLTLNVYSSNGTEGVQYRLERVPLLQIVTNLMHNAIKFTQRGEVTVRWKVLRDLGGEHQLEISVSDTGMGMSEKQKSELFQRFRKHTHGVENSKGAGLGLYLTRKLADRMGAQLEVQSRLGRGSVFKLTFTAEVMGMPVMKELYDDDARGKNVLVVDDNAMNLMVAKVALEDLGAFVDVVTSGSMALSACAGKRYDAVLIDLNMAPMDGLELARAIREEFSESTPELFLCSACDPALGWSMVKEHGFTGFVPKPLVKADLESMFSTDPSMQHAVRA